MKKPTGNGSKTEFWGKIPTENLTEQAQTGSKYKIQIQIHTERRKYKIQIHTEIHKYKYKYIMCICISTCICSSLLPSLLFLLVADHHFFETLPKRFIDLKLWFWMFTTFWLPIIQSNWWLKLAEEGMSQSYSKILRKRVRLFEEDQGGIPLKRRWPKRHGFWKSALNTFWFFLLPNTTSSFGRWWKREEVKTLKNARLDWVWILIESRGVREGRGMIYLRLTFLYF